MIYVTVGRPRHGFDRLIKAVDEMASLFGEDVFIQTGNSAYVPVNSAHSDFLTFPEAEELLKTASLVISHAGIGTIIGAMKTGTPIVVVPRRKKYGEHFNDHQMQIAEAVKSMPGIEVVYDVDGVGEAARRLLGSKGTLKPSRHGQELVRAIGEFLEDARKGRR